jgi:modified peptide precursor CbpA
MKKTVQNARAESKGFGLRKSCAASGSGLSHYILIK